MGGLIYPDSSKGFVCGSEGIIHSPEGMIDPRLPIPTRPSLAWNGSPEVWGLACLALGLLASIARPLGTTQRNSTSERNQPTQVPKGITPEACNLPTTFPYYQTASPQTEGHPPQTHRAICCLTATLNPPCYPSPNPTP